MSSSGARLAFAEVLELPPVFELEVSSLDLRVEVTVVWSNAKQHGVKFVWPQHTPWA